MSRLTMKRKIKLLPNFVYLHLFNIVFNGVEYARNSIIFKAMNLNGVHSFFKCTKY